MTTTEIRALRNSLDKALDLLHDINTKLYIAEASTTTLADADLSIGTALKAGHAAHKQMTALLGETPRYDD